MEEIFDRTRLLLGNEAMIRLSAARVAVFGIGGVGGHVCEALARTGVGALDLIDNDTVAPSNLNRQIIATRSSLGRFKTDVMRDRIADINPACQVNTWHCFVLPDNVGLFPFEAYDYVVDAVDTVSAKLAIIERAKICGVPVISSMGAGNKLDGSRFQIIDLFKTRMDPLAKVMRRELKKRAITSLKVVWSDEPPIVPYSEETLPHSKVTVSHYKATALHSEATAMHSGDTDQTAGKEASGSSLCASSVNMALASPQAPFSLPYTEEAAAQEVGQRPYAAANKPADSDSACQMGARPARRRPIPGSVAFVPAVAGLLLAGTVVQDLTQIK